VTRAGRRADSSVPVGEVRDKAMGTLTWLIDSLPEPIVAGIEISLLRESLSFKLLLELKVAVAELLMTMSKRVRVFHCIVNMTL